MKKAWNWMILVILAAGMMLPICAEALGRTGTVPRIILFTFYRQAGWGDRVQIGCVDENGGIWAGAGFDSTLKWPYKAEEQLAYLQSGKNLEKIGQMDSGKLFDLKGLVESVPDQGQKSYPAANDAGTEKSYAVQYVILALMAIAFWERQALSCWECPGTTALRTLIQARRRSIGCCVE